MPIYQCVTSQILSPELKAAIAKEITRVHVEFTAAPEPFVNVVFSDLPLGSHYLAGAVRENGTLINAIVRAGRSLELRQALLKTLSAAGSRLAGQPERNLVIRVEEADAETNHGSRSHHAASGRGSRLDGREQGHAWRTRPNRRVSQMASPNPPLSHYQRGGVPSAGLGNVGTTWQVQSLTGERHTFEVMSAPAQTRTRRYPFAMSVPRPKAALLRIPAPAIAEPNGRFAVTLRDLTDFEGSIIEPVLPKGRPGCKRKVGRLRRSCDGTRA